MKNSPRKPVRVQQTVGRLTGEEVGFNVEREEINAAKLSGAATLGLPCLMQGELGAGDIVELVHLLVVIEQFVAIDGSRHW